MKCRGILLGFACVGLIFLGSAASVFCQIPKNPGAELTKFEKSIEEGKSADIEGDVLKYLIANPNDARGFEIMGRLRFSQGRLTEAKSLFTRAVVLDPGSATTRIALAKTDHKLGDSVTAKEVLSGIDSARLGDDRTRLDLAETFATLGECSQALSIAEKLAPAFLNTRAIPLRANCFLQTGNRQKIADLIPPAEKLNKSETAIAVSFSEILSKAGMQSEAAAMLKNALRKDPDNVPALILLSRSQIDLRDTDSAKAHLDRAESLDPQAAGIFLVRAMLESEAGHQPEAVGLFEKYLLLNPYSIEALSRLVIAAMRADQAGKAVSAAEKLLQLEPDRPEFLYLHGAASLQAGNLAAAERSLIGFLRLSPDDSRGCLALGLTYAAQSEKLEEAREQMRKCIQLDPGNFEAKYQLGLSYKTQGETKRAIASLEEVVAQKADYSNALRDLGILYLQDGAEQKARAALEKAALLNPEDADSHFQLSRLYNLIGEPDLAKKHLKIFQELRNRKTGPM